MPNRAAITQDELASWKEQPATQWVFAALGACAEAQRSEWIAASWDAGNADRDLLIETRTRADTFAAMQASDYEDFCAALGEEPVREA